jgi:serine/threonine protein kinase
MEEVQRSDYERSVMNIVSDEVLMTLGRISSLTFSPHPPNDRITWSRVRKSPNFDFRSSVVLGGVVLKDDSFSFVLQREGVDLRKLIDVFQDENSLKWEPKNRIFGEYLTFHPQHSNRRGVGPVFKHRLTHGIIYQIALGMRELHEFDILHRDLKASNVLISDIEKFPKFDQTRWIQLKVVDYECSIGVVGTGFWKAPEILRQLKDPKCKHPLHFMREVDVYSFAMTCYEVLTGSIPLEEYATSDYDVVLGGMRPSLPEYIPSWLRNLILCCWHDELAKRPTFEAIVEARMNLYNIFIKVPMNY